MQLGTQDVTAVLVSVKTGASIDRAKAQIAALMREGRHIAENEDDIFRSSSG